MLDQAMDNVIIPGNLSETGFQFLVEVHTIGHIAERTWKTRSSENEGE